jgi:glycosyltransferase involved in cell wall biosynthesis
VNNRTAPVNPKKIIISVTNDLTIDQRVDRIATTLSQAGLDVLLVGRKLPNSQPLASRIYMTHRLKLPFHKGGLFYAVYNIWLFVFILFRKTNALLSNDLDTLPANYLASKIKGVPLIFDSHEYFPEVPELIDRPRIKKIWIRVEKMFVPQLQFSYTVCQSISNIYSEKYGVKMAVVRNLPFKKHINSSSATHISESGEKVILYQGALNVGRGIEMVIDAVTYLDKVKLLIAGDGNIASQLRNKVKSEGLENKVQFLGRLSWQELHNYAVSADLGFSLEENMGLNYYYALPNKLFDYIQAGVPVLVSDFPEMSAIVKHYNIGLTLSNRDPKHVAEILRLMLFDQPLRAQWKENLQKAAEELCWENEMHILLDVYKRAGVIK